MFMSFGPISLFSPHFPFSSAAISLLLSCCVLGLFVFFLFPVCCVSSLVINIVEYSGVHDISLLTSQAKAGMQRIFCGFNEIVVTQDL